MWDVVLSRGIYTLALQNPREKKTGHTQTSEQLHNCGQEERMVLELLRVWRVWRTIGFPIEM